MRYRFAGKETIPTLGRYPDMSLKDARTECLKAHVLSKDGINPNQLKRERKIRIIDDHDSSFDKITELWFNKVSHELKDSTLRKHQSRLNKYLLPALGKYPITAVTRQLILEIGQTIQQLVSTSSFCCDDNMPRGEQSVPKLCRNCNSKNIESEIVSPDHAVKSHHSIQESNTARAIPTFLKRINEMRSKAIRDIKPRETSKPTSKAWDSSGCQ